MKTYYGIADLMKLNLQGFPTTRRGWEKYVLNNQLDYKEVPSRGKGGVRREYELNSDLRELLVLKKLEKEVVDAPLKINSDQSKVVQSALSLMDWQREIAESRLYLVRYVQQQITQGMGKTDAVMQVVNGAVTGELATTLLECVLRANAKSGGKCEVSRRSMFEWLRVVEEAELAGVSVIAALAPKTRKQKKIPEWAGVLLEIWAQPQNPTLAACLDILAERYKGEMPSYHTARRFIHEQLGNVDRHKGRMGQREIKNIKGFIRRGTEHVMPTDIYTADGHCFDAEVAHPMHGKPFRPEITSILDVGTRRLVGWSVALAESSWAVLDAIRMSCMSCGIPAIFYVDNGSGYKNDVLNAQGRGVLSRLHVTVKHALPYNSQAKGLIERSHQTLWIKAAKNMPTYIGKDMDAEASQKVHKLTRRDIALAGRSSALMSWRDFVAYAAVVVDEYNNRPHSSLKRVVDEVTMKTRYQTPNEAWQEAVMQGVSIDVVEDWDGEDLFRPYEERKVLRCEINLFSNRYFARELEQFHGDMVLVGYDIHCAEKVTVRTLDGEFICHAIWNANKRDYMPKPVIEQAREQRAAGRLRRLAVKQSEVMQELRPQHVLEHLEEQTIIPFPMRERELVFAELEALPSVVEKPVFDVKFSLPEVEVAGAVADDQVQRWICVDSLVLGQEVIEEKELEFWKLFQMSKKFKRLTIEDAQLQAHLDATEQTRLALGL